MAGSSEPFHLLGGHDGAPATDCRYCKRAIAKGLIEPLPGILPEVDVTAGRQDGANRWRLSERWQEWKRAD